MLARVQSYLLQGIDALPCEVEVDNNPLAMSDESGEGGGRAMIVGLPDAAVKESVERVRSALSNSGHMFPQGKTLINLAPADVRKEGPLYDLPIAVGLLMAQGALARTPQSAGGKRGGGTSGGAGSAPSTVALAEDAPDPRKYVFAGELALDGRLRPIRGVLSMAALARAKGYRGVVVPADNAAEASLVSGIESIGVRTLTEVIGWLMGAIELHPHPPMDVEGTLRSAEAPVDFADVRGQESVKRAIVVAAAGAHNLLMLGPAGTGKTMMARALPGVLPPLTAQEAIDVTRIYSAAGQLAPGQGMVTIRPVRTPHHTASGAAIVGGGMVPKPGEISLAHRGVLFLDELPEFPRDVLETLRQPLEDHVVTIARSHSAVRFPASFMLVAAMNPTPKGDVPRDEVGKRAMDRYLSKLSGPLVDRIDIHIEAPAVPWAQLSKSLDQSAPRGTSSAQMREQVLSARRIQNQRQSGGGGAGGDEKGTTPNARLSGRQLDELAPMSEDAKVMLGQAMTELGLSARAYDKIRRVGRTIADLAGAKTIEAEHVAEAIGYRLLDRKG
ncbi:MAG: YifB family Mg chelatase-like AAA ATPase [Phycisphaerales bacterium]|nr:YifB family Mg chelatase-like AAA ATPase [Phycisphaerales bacterium]